MTDPAAAAASLPGLLIGAEIACLPKDGRKVRLLAAEPAAALYGTVLTRARIGFETEDAELLSRRGNAIGHSNDPKNPLPQVRRPLVAILRGIRPEEAPAIFDVLVDEGFEAIEVPLNSSDPLRTIEAAVKEFGQSALIGAGTVLEPENVDRLADIGAKLVVTPNTDPAVIGRAAGHAMIAMPGVFTPTEALLAWRSGASALKFFPAGILGAAGIAQSGRCCPQKRRSPPLGVSLRWISAATFRPGSKSSGSGHRSTSQV